MKKTNLILLFWVLLVLLNFGKASGVSEDTYNKEISFPNSSKVFLVGASVKNITPPLDQLRSNIDFVHDSLYVRTLLLDDGDTKLLFVVLDSQGFESYFADVAKKEVQERTGIPAKNIVISATHSHSTANARGKTWTSRESWDNGWILDTYQSFLVQKIAEGAKKALDNLQPAHIGWGKGTVPHHVYNRRFKIKEPVSINPFGKIEYVQTNPRANDPNILEPAGPTDPEVSFVSVQSTKGQPIALFANYSAHYAAGVPSNHISADYYGVFAGHIKMLLKAESQDVPFVGIICAGAAGNTITTNRGAPFMKYAPYEKVEKVGFDLATEVYRVYSKVDHKPWVKLDVIQSQLLPIDVRKPTSEELAQAKFLQERRKTNKEQLYHRLELSLARQVIRLHEVYPDQLSVTLQAFRIGDLVVGTIPFEPFTEIGLELKERSPFESTFIMGLANGTYIYLPTAKQFDMGGYETWMGLSNRVERNSAEKITTELLLMFSKLKD